MPDPTYAPLYAGGPAQADQVFLQNLPASLDFSVQASFDESLSVSPSRWLGRYLQQEGVTGDDTSTPLVPVEAAQEYLKAGGFDPSTITEPIHQATLNRLTDRLYEKRAHEDAIARGPGGFMAGAARFGAGLAAQALDPLNVAAGFIPIFRASTIDTLLGAAGTSALSRAAVRAQVGAVEGAVGTAMLEPGMHFLASQLHEDYTMADSLLNVAFGTVLGGGLHVGVGAVADWRLKAAAAGLAPTPDATPPVHELAPQPGTPQRIAALSPEARIEIGRIALAQAIDGRDIDIASTIDVAELTQRAIEQERQPGFLKTAEDLLAQRQEERLRNQPGFLQTALDKMALQELDTTRAAEDARIQERLSGEIQQEIGKIQDAQRRELEQTISQQTPDVNAARLADLMEAQQLRTELLNEPKRLVEEAKARDLTPDELAAKIRRLNEQAAREIQTYKQHVLAQIGQVSPEGIARLNGERRSIAERLHETAARGQSPEAQLRPADAALSKEADEIIETNKTPEGETETAAAQKELQDETANLERLLAVKESKADPAKMFAAHDEAIAQAKTDTKIMSAIAECRLRKG